MIFDCIIIKDGVTPHIHQVGATNANFCIVDEYRRVIEEFAIQQFELPDPESGRNALFLFALKMDCQREQMIEQIDILRPRPVRFID
ncbi:hypothetical protein F3J37_02155 [Pantoea sp. Al-1710]|uniref:Uncharacterized protein n=1 Tax=Candidatus Pantoea communis TaxID=2608354 RepID=A0ABX0RIM7_9GAMM|nr:hypothetical protein [Pantoea communis]NIG17481.1 hypothetical protein [Pantoea communis]